MRMVLACIMLLVVPTGFGGTQGITAIEREVISASKARAEAFNRHDIDGWSRFIANDCLLSRDFGDLSSRDALALELRGLRAGDEQIVNLRNFESRTVGTTVLLHYNYDDREQFGNAVVVSTLAATEVWARRGGQWVAVASAVTPVPINHRKPIAVESKRLAEYSGQFEWRPGLVDTITVDGDHLVSKLGDSPPQPIYFSAPDVEFAPGELGEALVQRTPGGDVTGYIFRRSDGQEITVRKLR